MALTANGLFAAASDLDKLRQLKTEILLGSHKIYRVPPGVILSPADQAVVDKANAPSAPPLPKGSASSTDMEIDLDGEFIKPLEAKGDASSWWPAPNNATVASDTATYRGRQRSFSPRASHNHVPARRYRGAALQARLERDRRPLSRSRSPPHRRRSETRPRSRSPPRRSRSPLPPVSSALMERRRSDNRSSDRLRPSSERELPASSLDLNARRNPLSQNASSSSLGRRPSFSSQYESSRPNARRSSPPPPIYIRANGPPPSYLQGTQSLEPAKTEKARYAESITPQSRQPVQPSTSLESRLSARTSSSTLVDIRSDREADKQPLHDPSRNDQPSTPLSERLSNRPFDDIDGQEIPATQSLEERVQPRFWRQQSKPTHANDRLDHANDRDGSLKTARTNALPADNIHQEPQRSDDAPSAPSSTPSLSARISSETSILDRVSTSRWPDSQHFERFSDRLAPMPPTSDISASSERKQAKGSSSSIKDRVAQPASDNLDGAPMEGDIILITPPKSNKPKQANLSLTPSQAKPQTAPGSYERRPRQRSSSIDGIPTEDTPAAPLPPVMATVAGSRALQMKHADDAVSSTSLEAMSEGGNPAASNKNMESKVNANGRGKTAKNARNKGTRGQGNRNRSVAGRNDSANAKQLPPPRDVSHDPLPPRDPLLPQQPYVPSDPYYDAYSQTAPLPHDPYYAYPQPTLLPSNLPYPYPERRFAERYRGAPLPPVDAYDMPYESPLQPPPGARWSPYELPPAPRSALPSTYYDSYHPNSSSYPPDHRRPSVEYGQRMGYNTAPSAAYGSMLGPPIGRGSNYYPQAREPDFNLTGPMSDPVRQGRPRDDWRLGADPPGPPPPMRR